jgi:hypothetical protein
MIETYVHIVLSTLTQGTISQRHARFCAAGSAATAPAAGETASGPGTPMTWCPFFMNLRFGQNLDKFEKVISSNSQFRCRLSHKTAS